MSVEAVRRLGDAWKNDDGLQSALNSSFDQIGFTEKYIDAACAIVTKGLTGNKPKYIKDNVWGMIELDAQAVRLLDCPLVQRLRNIKQLGFSYLTYPSAEHSRFVHSLGMSAVVREFLRSIDSRDSASRPSLGRAITSDNLDSLSAPELVHAALLHDIGHMPFSHASEFALQSHEEIFSCGKSRTVGDFLEEVEIHTGKSVGLAEALSICIVLSTRFRDFYTRVVQGTSEGILRIACLIVALPPDPRLSGVTEIISSAAIDADKIDYVTRDAKACGIPVGVDVARIFLRSSFVEVSAEEIIAAELKDNPEPNEVLFVVNASGVDTLDEISQSRASLYQRVYLHAVTRTAEAMLASALQAIASDPVRQDDDLIDAFGLWMLSDAELLGRLVSSSSAAAAQLGLALRNRQIPKKACVFSASIADMHMPLKKLIKDVDVAQSDDVRKIIVNTPLEHLTDKLLRGPAGDRLKLKIQGEVFRLVEYLKSDSAPEELIPKTELGELLLVGTSYMDKARKDCIVLQNGELLRTKKFTNVGGTHDAFELVKAVGFVMSDSEWAPLVLIAARSVLSEPSETPKDVDLNINQGTNTKAIKLQLVERMLLDLKGVMRRSGVSRERFTAAIEASERAGYFDSRPLLARPLDVKAKGVSEVWDRLSAFDGQYGWRVRPETIVAFVNQFPLRLRAEMLQNLGTIEFLSESVVGSGLLEKLTSSFGVADIAPLSPSSGTNTRTALNRAFVNEPRGAGLRIHSTIEAALDGGGNDPLILIDDNAVSATQSRAQLLQWFGIPRPEWPPECQLEDDLYNAEITDARLVNLRSRPIHVVVYAGHERASERLRHCSALAGTHGEIGFQSVISIQGKDNWGAELKNFLSRVGVSLLRRSLDRSESTISDPAQFCDDNAFGYGGLGGLLVTPTNVPTSTVTALWCPGIVAGSPWMPLVIRQKKFRHLVLG